jgi:hypothetical protein
LSPKESKEESSASVFSADFGKKPDEMARIHSKASQFSEDNMNELLGLLKELKGGLPQGLP